MTLNLPAITNHLKNVELVISKGKKGEIIRQLNLHTLVGIIQIMEEHKNFNELIIGLGKIDNFDQIKASKLLQSNDEGTFNLWITD